MKIAVFHNFLDNIGGAEMVTLTIAEKLGADIYTTNVDKEKIEKMGFIGVVEKIHSIGTVPKNAPLRQQMTLWMFKKLNLKKKYDFYIIGGDWAISGAINNKPNIWYAHSPIREIWDLYRDTRQKTVPYFFRWIFDWWVFYNRRLNKKYAGEAGKIICNSLNTRNRIEKFLNKKAYVIHPPVNASEIKFGKFGNYWLSVNRLISHKRVDMQLKAFEKMPKEKLIIIGSYEKSRHFLNYVELCLKISPKNVEIKKWISRKELIDLYAGCKGLIATSKDEDFGINAIEAMAAGKPVIAPNEGGYKETIINGKTGILIDDINENKLIAAIKNLDKSITKKGEEWKKNCIMQAAEFDSSIFIEKIKKFIKTI